MLRGLRRLRPSPALVVASIALAVSLGGVGYAATQLPRNSVGAAQLRNNAVSSAKVKNHSLKSSDFAHGVIRRGAPGATGATGPQGAPGVGIGGSCAAGSAIRAVATNGAVTCQADTNTTYDAAGPLSLAGTTFSIPAATDSSAGYLTAADHASFAAARTFTFSSSSMSNATYSQPNEVTYTTPKVTLPSNLHKLVVLFEGEWKGGTSTAPSTMDCAVGLDDPSFASIMPAASSRHSTSTGGYADFAVSAVFDVTPGQHEVEAGCENDTGGASIGSAHLTVIGSE